MKRLFRTRPMPSHSGCKPRDNPATARDALLFFFRQPGVLLLLVLSLGMLGYRVSLAPLNWLDAVILTVIVAAWPLLEWAVHVVLLHQKPRRIFAREFDFLLPQTHRWHHADPWNLRWVFIPHHIFPLLLPVLLLVVFGLAPNALIASSILAVYLALALHYEWVHYLAHISWCPPIRYYRRRVREHRLHHFRNEQNWWGVSLGLGDRLLGTAPDPSQTPATGTAATISPTSATEPRSPA